MNTAGQIRPDFYVEPDCCMLCGVPEDIAPELFHTGDTHCVMLRQPCSPAEIDKTIRAMWSAEADCIRYRGHDDAILRRLGEAGMAELADNRGAAAHRRIERRHALFSPHRQVGDGLPSTVAADFRSFLRRPERGTNRNKVLPRVLRPNSVIFAWYKLHFHIVTFSRRNDGRFLASLWVEHQGVAIAVDEWLKSGGYHDIEWISTSQLNTGTQGIGTSF